MWLHRLTREGATAWEKSQMHFLCTSEVLEFISSGRTRAHHLYIHDNGISLYKDWNKSFPILSSYFSCINKVSFMETGQVEDNLCGRPKENAADEQYLEVTSLRENLVKTWHGRLVTFLLRCAVLEILSGVTPRSDRTLAIPRASTPQLGATLVSHRLCTFILHTVKKRKKENVKFKHINHVSCYYNLSAH